MKHLTIIKTAMLASILLVTFGCEEDKENEGNHLPTVNITTSNQTVNVGDEVNLSATAIDVDGDSLTYLWSMKSKPENTQSVLSSSTTKKTSFKPDISGTYVLTFKANDGLSDSKLSEVTIESEVVLHPDPEPITLKEDCISHNLSNVKVIKDGSNWTITDGRSLMFAFKDKEEAERSLEIIKHYKMDKSCFVGRPNPNFSYMLVDNKAPENGIADEDCIGFNLDTVEVKKINNRYKIVDGSNGLFDFEDKKDEADKSLVIIKKYGFNQTCYVGRPDADFSYLRKGTDFVPVEKVYKVASKKFYSQSGYEEDRPSHQIDYSYNEKGNLLTVVSDEEKFVYSYDENDNLIKEENDDRKDGTIDNATTYTYDDKGNQLTRNYDFLNAAEDRHGVDDIADRVNSYTYDENGNMTIDLFHDLRSDVKHKDTYSYDEKGNKITHGIDHHNDGTPDNIVYYTYNEKNQLIKEFNDNAVEGNTDYTKIFVYDERGNRIKVLYKNSKSEGINRINVYTFDENNNKIKREIDFENDGTIDSVSTYEYDAHHNQIKIEDGGIVVLTWIEI